MIRRNSLRAVENWKSRMNSRNSGNSIKLSSKADRRSVFPSGSVSAQARRRVKPIPMVRRKKKKKNLCHHHQSQKRKKKKRKKKRKRRRKRKNKFSNEFSTVPDVVFLFDCTGLYTIYCDEISYDVSSSVYYALLNFYIVRTCVCIVMLTKLYIQYSLILRGKGRCNKSVESSWLFL